MNVSVCRSVYIFSSSSKLINSVIHKDEMVSAPMDNVRPFSPEGKVLYLNIKNLRPTKGKCSFKNK